MVKKASGIDKKIEFTRVAGKRIGTTSSHLFLKWTRDFRGNWRSTLKSNISERNWDHQPYVSMSSVQGPAWDFDVSNCEHYGKRLQDKCCRLSWAYFLCASLEHFARECSKSNNTTPIPAHRSTPTAKNWGINRDSFVLRGALRKRSETIVHQSEVKAPTRVYVVRTREEGDTIDVVTSIFLLFSVPVYTLIDPRFSYSYINDELIKFGSLKLETSKVAMVVSSLLG